MFRWLVHRSTMGWVCVTMNVLPIAWDGKPAHGKLILRRGRFAADQTRSQAHMHCTDEPVPVPVQALRITHQTINAEFAFGGDHDNRQE